MMTAENIPTPAVLALEIGSVHTRAVLFEVVEDYYHFVASGVAPSSYNAPEFDASLAAYKAISRLQEVTGRVLFNRAGELLISTASEGQGVDNLVITTSCGPSINIVTCGLLDDISLESAGRLADTIYGRVVESISINDHRPIHAQLDAIVAARPDLLIFAGGVDNGAGSSLMRMSELVIGALRLLPGIHRPRILVCGNTALSQKLSESFDHYTRVRIADNIRPTVSEEKLDPAMGTLSDLVTEIQSERIGGLKKIGALASVPPRLSNQAFYQVIRFLAHQYDPAKGVLGLDMGGSSSSAVYANRRHARLKTFHYGLGSGLEQLLRDCPIHEVSRWLCDETSDDDVQDFLWQRTLFPSSISSTPAELAIELAAARQVLRLMLRDLIASGVVTQPRFEPILLSGTGLTRTATPWQSLRVILDGIQPLGICPFILDKHGILPTLGAAAEISPILAVQVLESSAFTNLATVVNVVSRSRRGIPVLSIRMRDSAGKSMEAEVKQGSILALPLEPGATAELVLKPLKPVMIEAESTGDVPIKVHGGVCGVIFDARGRPLQLPDDPSRRRDQLLDWDYMLGGSS